MHVITTYWMRVYFDHQLCLLFSNIYWNYSIDRWTRNHALYNSWCTIKTTILQSGLFLSDIWRLLSLIQPLPPPLDPRRPLLMLYIYICIATFNCPKGILGPGGESILKQTERRQFYLFNDKRHNFMYISYACAEGIPQSFGNERLLYP